MDEPDLTAGRRGAALPLLPLTLALIVAGALFPFGWLGELWPGFGDWLAWAFATPAAHVAGHAGIFLCLGLAALTAWPALLRQPGRYAALIGAAALGQELLQRAHKGLVITGDDLFDLTVDLLAGAAAFALARAAARRRGAP